MRKVLQNLQMPSTLQDKNAMTLPQTLLLSNFCEQFLFAFFPGVYNCNNHSLIFLKTSNTEPFITKLPFLFQHKTAKKNCHFCLHYHYVIFTTSKTKHSFKSSSQNKTWIRQLFCLNQLNKLQPHF